MKINEIEFVKSSAKLDQCPHPNKIEYAFVGRSNVGKSSLINMLTGRKKIAMTSGNPGKTRLINHFMVNKDWYLVDLPGYGYAKVSKKDRATFDELIRTYLKKRENLTCLFFLIDCRHSPIKSDIEFMRWLGENQVPFVIIFTKADKLSDNQLKAAITDYKEYLLSEWEELPETFISSASKGIGREEILKFIDSTNKMLKMK